MIKKINVNKLKPGMFVHDLNCSIRWTGQLTPPITWTRPRRGRFFSCHTIGFIHRDCFAGNDIVYIGVWEFGGLGVLWAWRFVGIDNRLADLL